MKNLFNQFSVHTYDFAKDLDNKLTFKVRKLADSVPLGDKINEIASNILSDKGLKLQSTNPKFCKQG